MTIGPEPMIRIFFRSSRRGTRGFLGGAGTEELTQSRVASLHAILGTGLNSLELNTRGRVLSRGRANLELALAGRGALSFRSPAGSKDFADRVARLAVPCALACRHLRRKSSTTSGGC